MASLNRPTNRSNSYRPNWHIEQLEPRCMLSANGSSDNVVNDGPWGSSGPHLDNVLGPPVVVAREDNNGSTPDIGEAHFDHILGPPMLIAGDDNTGFAQDLPEPYYDAALGAPVLVVSGGDGSETPDTSEVDYTDKGDTGDFVAAPIESPQVLIAIADDAIGSDQSDYQSDSYATIKIANTDSTETAADESSTTDEVVADAEAPLKTAAPVDEQFGLTTDENTNPLWTTDDGQSIDEGTDDASTDMYDPGVVGPIRYSFAGNPDGNTDEGINDGPVEFVTAELETSAIDTFGADTSDGELSTSAEPEVWATEKGLPDDSQSSTITETNIDSGVKPIADEYADQDWTTGDVKANEEPVNIGPIDSPNTDVDRPIYYAFGGDVTPSGDLDSTDPSPLHPVDNGVDETVDSSGTGTETPVIYYSLGGIHADNDQATRDVSVTPPQVMPDVSVQHDASPSREVRESLGAVDGGDTHQDEALLALVSTANEDSRQRRDDRPSSHDAGKTARNRVADLDSDAIDAALVGFESGFANARVGSSRGA